MNWFFPWPESALIDVAENFLSGFPLEATADVYDGLIRHMAFVHDCMTDVGDQYFQQYRRRVYSTPRSFLFFVNSFKTVYTQKLSEVSVLAKKINTGLDQVRFPICVCVHSPLFSRSSMC